MSKPPRLGKGLSALLGEASSGPTDASRTLPTASLRPGPFQARGPMDGGALEELATSIRRHGVLQPILVRPAGGEFEIIGGERRWRAAQLAQLHEVPVLVRDFDDGEAMAAGLVENLQREDLNPLEEAEGYNRLMEQFGLTQLALSEAVGKSRSHVANTLRLLALPERVRELLRDGAITAGHARAVANAPDPIAAALQVVDRGLSVRQAESLATARPAAAPMSDPDTRAMERELADHLGLEVIARHNGTSGQITIKYRSLDQMDGLLQQLLRKPNSRG